MPAPMRTMFLMMYWASRIGANGKVVNVSRGNMMSGMTVPIIWVARSRRVARRNRFEISPRPIKHSQVASTGSETAGPTSPTVRPSNRATCQVLGGTEARHELQRTEP